MWVRPKNGVKALECPNKNVTKKGNIFRWEVEMSYPKQEGVIPQYTGPPPIDLQVRV